MKILLLHTPTPTGSPKQVAINSDEILRMEEVEGGTTQIIQQDKGPTTVVENLQDILKALGAEVKEVKPEPKHQDVQPGHPESQALKSGQPIGQAHGAPTPKAGGR